ncbi:hypothetical protein NL676_029588 [Syzygium grande]|nr:hypothetical protein NL676_029588 [Syzygium grande]
MAIIALATPARDLQARSSSMCKTKEESRRTTKRSNNSQVWPLGDDVREGRARGRRAARGGDAAHGQGIIGFVLCWSAVWTWTGARNMV